MCVFFEKSEKKNILKAKKNGKINSTKSGNRIIYLVRFPNSKNWNPTNPVVYFYSLIFFPRQMVLLVKKIHMRLTQTLMRMWSNRKQKWKWKKWNRKWKLKSINLPKMEFQKKNQQKPYLSFHLCPVILTEKYFSCLDLFLPMKFESQLIGTVNQNWTFHSETFRGKNKACFWSIGYADVKNIRKLNNN